MKSKLFIGILALAALVSCKAVSHLSETASELFRGEVVARVGDHRLHRSQLESYIPAGVSPEDSASLARQFIQTWAEELLLMDMAQEQLSPQEMDVTQELEEYRKSLIKFRYQQLYIQQRLDTLVTDQEMAAFYEANPQRFKLERPIVKSRYMIIPADSRSLKAIKAKMSSDDAMEAVEADSMAVNVAIKYVDSSDTWMDALALAVDLGTEYRVLHSRLKGSFVEIPDEESGNLRVIYIVEMVQEGKTAPLEYCQERIRDLILSARKHSLEEELERDLLEDARKNNKFVVY